MQDNALELKFRISTMLLLSSLAAKLMGAIVIVCRQKHVPALSR